MDPNQDATDVEESKYTSHELKWKSPQNEFSERRVISKNDSYRENLGDGVWSSSPILHYLFLHISWEYAKNLGKIFGFRTFLIKITFWPATHHSIKSNGGVILIAE